MNALSQFNRELADLFGNRRTASQKLMQAERAKSAGGMKKAKALAKVHAIEIEKDTAGGWWVTCPAVLEGSDPLDGARFCTDGREVLETVQATVDAMQAAGIKA